MDYKDNQEDEIIREDISEILDADGRVIESFGNKEKKNKSYIKIDLNETSGIKGFFIKFGVGLLILALFLLVTIGMISILIPAILLSVIAFFIRNIKNKFRKR